MKFSKILTTAMMALALVASSSAFAAEETPWWSMNFDGLAIEEGGSLTNTLNAAYGTTQNGAWSTEEGDLSELVDNKLKLNTQGTDLTWTPNGDNDTTAITYIDADVTFVGSDTAPTISEKDVHTAVYLKNIIDDETGEIDSSVLCAWGRTSGQDSEGSWIELVGAVVNDGETYRLRIMLEGNELTYFIGTTKLTTVDGKDTILSAKEASGVVESVSFRGTGFVDNFAASQAVKESAGSASLSIAAYYNDEDIDPDAYTWLDQSEDSINLDSSAVQIASVTTTLFDNNAEDFVADGAMLSCVGVKINDGVETLIQYNAETGAWPTDTMLTFGIVEDIYYSVTMNPSQLSNGDNVKVVFYYGTHTPSEEPDPEPVQLEAPVVTAATTETAVTLTWDAVANATGYEVTFNGTTTTVTDPTFTASDLTASTDYSYSVVAKGDGVNYTNSAAASGTATTATPAEPEPEFAPVAVAAIAIDGTTATLTIEGEYTEVKVLFCETLGGEWVEVEATFADGVATVPATTATGFFKVEAK